MKIIEVKGYEILDSRANPTLEVFLKSEKSSIFASVPSGKSKGIHEVFELRDNNEKRYRGKGVLKAANIINTTIKNLLVGKDSKDFDKLEIKILSLDESKNKGKIGGNTTLAISIGLIKLYSCDYNMELFQAIREYYEKIAGVKIHNRIKFPTPMANVINGGVHAGNDLSFQEFMIIPKNIDDILEKIRAICEIYYELKDYLLKNYGKNAINVGDEGGFSPPMKENEEALEALSKCIEECGYSKDVYIGLDCAASQYYSNGYYNVDGKKLNLGEYFEYLVEIIKTWNIFSIEDPFFEEDFNAFAVLTEKIGKKVLVVGDDLYTTNPERLKKGIKNCSSNAILIKPNQIGSVRETLEVIKIATENKMKTIISHRSGETNDTFIIHLAIGVNSPFVKIGAPCRGERVEKYNELIRIRNIFF